MRPDLVLRAPWPVLYLAVMSVSLLPLGLWGAISITDASATPVRTGVAYIGGLLLSWVFFAVVVVANVRVARLSVDGLRMRVVSLFRYDLDVRWDQIERISLDAGHFLGPMMTVRLKDPDPVAGVRRWWSMRRVPALRTADVPLLLAGIRPGREAITEALPLLSGGLHRLEPAVVAARVRPRPRDAVRTTAAGITIIGVLLPALTFAGYGLLEGRWHVAVPALLLSAGAALFLRRLLGNRRASTAP